VFAVATLECGYERKLTSTLVVLLLQLLQAIFIHLCPIRKIIEIVDLSLRARTEPS